MMNRGVLQRQMFANGGQAVPNEYKGFSKLPEAVQMRMDPVAAKKYQEGGPVAQGIATMAPEMGAAVPAMAAAPEGAGMIADQVMDPAALQEMLGGAAEDLQDLENAEDFETVMNSMRGDDATVEDRREELASLVGPEDAAQTPESVLALVQPVIMMAGIDQGIGGLAQEEMTQEVSGPMAEGIMSTVAPPQPAAPGPEMMGGPPPVNFNQGGLVRRGDNQPVKMMQAGGDPFANAQGRLGELARERMAVREGLIGDPAGRLQEQKDLTKSQMLFDIANTALAFAAPMQGETAGLSAAERLAMAAQQTQLPQTIGARAAQLGEFKSGLAKEKQALQLAALGSAETALAAEAKAAEDIKLQELKAAQDLANMKLQDKLDFSSDVKLEAVKQTGRMEALEAESDAAIALENQRQVNRGNMEKVLQENRVAIEKLSQSGSAADRKLAAKLRAENIVLQGNIDLTKQGLANEFDLKKMEIGHGYATELQNSRLAVQESIASNRLSFDEIQAKLNQARADKELAIKQENLELQQAAEERITVFEQQSMDLKDREVTLKEQESRLGKLNVEGKNKAQQILARPDLLEGYANNTLGKAETLAVNSAIDQLSTRETIPGPDGTSVQTGGNIPEAARQAVLARSKLTAPEGQTLLMPRDLKRITAEPKQFGEAVSRIMSDVPDASVAFGSDAAARNVANVLIEATTFGLADAPYQATDKAISAVKQLNLDTVTHFQDIKEIRDSVALFNALKEQTANPNEFLTGDTRARNKTKTVLNTIDDLIDILDLKIENATGVEKLNEANLQRQKALQLRAGFEVIDRAYAKLGSGGRTTTPEVEAQQDQILFGD